MESTNDEKGIERLVDDRFPFHQQKDPFQTPCYDGKDTNLNKEPYCFACHDKDGLLVCSGLKRCSRCKVAWYCDAQCQKKHFKHHREICNRITEARKRLELANIPLQNSDALSDDRSLVRQFFGENDAEEVGECYNARFTLADVYWNAAYECEIKEVWEEALRHCENSMAAEAEHDVAVRIPFILLYLNRDDEAYAFIQFWLKERTMSPTRPYPVEPNCRYLDIFEAGVNFEEDEEQDFRSSYLLALAVIKMRIIAYQDAIAQSIDIAFEQTGGKRIQEVRPLVQEILMGNETVVAKQREQLYRIFDELENDLPCILGSIINCEHISEIRQFMELDEALESVRYVLLKDELANGVRCVLRVPGAVDTLWSYVADAYHPAE